MLKKWTEFLLACSRHERPVWVRTIATIFGAGLFLAGFPWLAFFLNAYFQCPVMFNPAFAYGAAGICFILGTPWMVWSVVWQLARGKGTPVPLVPPTVFLPTGPYRHVRNPMMFGFFLYFLGWVFVSNGVAGFAWWVIFVAIMLFEIRCVEEHELEERFGSSYREYKSKTPFLIPKWPGNL